MKHVSLMRDFLVSDGPTDEQGDSRSWIIEEIQSEDWGNIFQMIEDLRGCFHHFSHLLACPQGDGRKYFSEDWGNILLIIEEILSNY